MDENEKATTDEAETTKNLITQNEDRNVGKTDDETDVPSEITSLVTRRMTLHDNSNLVAQVQKAFPDVQSVEKMDTLHNELKQLSEDSRTEDPEDEQYLLKFKVPRESITGEIILEKYVVEPEKGEELLTEEFIKNLPIPIAKKREYRQYITQAFKRKPWYSRLRDSFGKKYSNIRSSLHMWNTNLKLIEEQHGSAVVSYFIFIRWLFFMNLMILALHIVFLLLPQLVLSSAKTIPVSTSTSRNVSSLKYSFADELGDEFMRNFHDVKDAMANITNSTVREILVEHCHELYVEQVANSTYTGIFTSIQSFLQGTGFLEHTHLFIGYYPPYNIRRHEHVHAYSMSVAFLCVFVATFAVCLCMMIQYSTTGAQESYMLQTRKTSYANEVFCAWDTRVTDKKGADQLHNRIVRRIQTCLSEDRRQREVQARSTREWVKLYAVRISVNVFTIIWLVACSYAVYYGIEYQITELQKLQLVESGIISFLVQFLPSIIIVVCNSFSRVIFAQLVKFETYSAETQINITLLRNVVLYLSSLVVLLNAFYVQVGCTEKDFCRVGLNNNCRSPRCWETYIGQQLYRLTLIDLFVYVGIFFYDFLQYFVTEIFHNRLTRCWGHPIFDVPVEVLAVINSQTLLWLGVFYCPLLPVLMVFKLFLIFYLKKTKVLSFCEPPEIAYPVSKVNSVFIFILLISFFVVTCVQSFAIDSISPSRGCGPFRYFDAMIEGVPTYVRHWLMSSNSAIILLTLTACIAIHFYCVKYAKLKQLKRNMKTTLVVEAADKEFCLKTIAELSKGKSVNMGVLGQE